MSLCNGAFEVPVCQYGKLLKSFFTYIGKPVWYLHDESRCNVLERTAMLGIRWRNLRRRRRARWSSQSTPSSDNQETEVGRNGMEARTLAPTCTARHKYGSGRRMGRRENKKGVTITRNALI